MELTELPEPVMAQFDRLPFAMQMRVAARVMDAVNQRCRTDAPRMGLSANEPISPSSMRYLADQWERVDYEAKLSSVVSVKGTNPTGEAGTNP